MEIFEVGLIGNLNGIKTIQLMLNQRGIRGSGIRMEF